MTGLISEHARITKDWLSVLALATWACVAVAGLVSCATSHAQPEGAEAYAIRDEAPRLDVTASPTECVSYPCEVHLRARLRGELRGRAWLCPMSEWTYEDDTRSRQWPASPCLDPEPQRYWPLLGNTGADYMAHTIHGPGQHEECLRLTAARADGKVVELVRGCATVRVPVKG